MKLTYNKQTTEQKEIDIDLPAFYESYGIFAMLKQDGTIVKAAKSNVFINKKDESASYQRDLAELLASWKPSSVDQFEAAINGAIEMAKAQVPELEIA